MDKGRVKAHLHPLMWSVIGLGVATVLIFAIAMIIPPEGEVAKSVLEGMCIITAQMALIVFAYAIVSGRTATFTHGNTTATVGKAKTDGDNPSN